MKKNLRVIQINGFRGLLMALFVISCLIAGFIAFPSFVAMNLWNMLAVKTSSFPTISFYGGLLLWGIIVFSVYLFNKRKLIVSFNTKHELSDEEVKDVISRFKAQSMQTNLLQNEELNLASKNEEESKDLELNSKE